MAAGRMRSSSGFNNEVESKAAGPESWSRTENNGVSRGCLLTGTWDSGLTLWVCPLECKQALGVVCFLGTVAGNGQQQQPVKCCDPVSDRLQAAGRAVLQPRCVWLWTSARSEGNLGADILLVREDFQRRTRYVYLLFIDVFIYYRRLDGWFKTGRWQVADVWV